MNEHTRGLSRGLGCLYVNMWSLISRKVCTPTLQQNSRRHAIHRFAVSGRAFTSVALLIFVACPAALTLVVAFDVLPPTESVEESPADGPIPNRRSEGARCLLQGVGRTGMTLLSQVEAEADDPYSVGSLKDSRTEIMANRFSEVNLVASASQFADTNTSPNFTVSRVADDVAPALVPARFVELSLYMNNLDEVNTKTATWVGDIIIGHRYTKADFDRKKEETRVQVDLVDCKVGAIHEVREWEEEGKVTMFQHLFVMGHYSAVYDQFPFDHQSVSVEVEIQGFSDGEVRFLPLANESGVRPYDGKNDNSFHTPQFYLEHWEFNIMPFTEHGMPYAKSRGQLRIFIERKKLVYFLIGCFLPALAICFALGAFCLPVNLIVPRMTISFTAFLAIFVHMKQMMSMMPEGVWCWLLSDLLFNSVVLVPLVLWNIASARVNATHAELGNIIDSRVRRVMPVEFLAGQIALVVFRRWHLYVIAVFFLHIAVSHGFYVLHFRKRVEETLAADAAKKTALASDSSSSSQLSSSHSSHDSSEGEPEASIQETQFRESEEDKDEEKLDGNKCSQGEHGEMGEESGRHRLVTSEPVRSGLYAHSQ